MPRHEVEHEELLDKRDSFESDDTAPSSPFAPRTVEKTHRWFSFSTSTHSKPRDNTGSERVPALVLWLAAAVVIVACTDLVALAYVAHMFDTVFQDNSFAATLEYANPYIGLKELYESGRVNASVIDPILIRPRVSAQVFVDAPDKLAPRGEHDYWSETWGMLSPNERHLHVTPTTHTIVQFRAIDFGMEHCHLVFTLPKLDVPLEEHASFAMHPASRFDVYRLAADRPIDVKKMSYQTKPTIATQVATSLEARTDGETLIYHFRCPWSSLHVFEIACAVGSECLVDVWSSQNTTYGVNIYQHQTV